MSHERLGSHEPATSQDFSFTLDTMRGWLTVAGAETGGQPDTVYPDGTAEYDVADDGSFSDAIKSFEIIVGADVLDRIPDRQLLETLHAGSEIRFTYTPAHYLRSRNNDKHEPYPESFQAIVTTAETSPYKELVLSVSHEDMYTTHPTGYRFVNAKNRTNVSEYSADELLHSFSDPVRTITDQLGTPTTEECHALIGIARFIERLK